MPPHSPYSERNVSETAKEKRDEWWHILKPVLECEPDIYERRRRGELLSEVAKRNNRDKANLYRYLVKDLSGINIFPGSLSYLPLNRL